MEKKTKYILIGLGVVAVGTGAYVLYQIQKKKRENTTREFENAIKNNSATLPSTTTSYTPPKKTSSSSGSSGFPLKKGSRGTLVSNLQNALIKKYGVTILPKYGADGDFGSETYNALISKGHPTVIDEDAFTKIVLGTGSNSSGSSTDSSSGGSSNSQIASKLHSAIAENNFTEVLIQLKKVKSVSSYTSVNTIFKQTRIGFVRKTLVTALLDQFKSSSEKKSLNQEFYRIGLKYDGAKWSLSGFSGMIDRLVTIEPTHVWDESGRTLNVPKATILGEYLDANDGVTEFETLDGRRLFVPTKSISYAS